jgi:hypothetical protein
MPYTFNLTHVSGKTFRWQIDDADAAIDGHGHVMGFTVRFADGTHEAFALAGTAAFARKLLSTPLDEIVSVSAGARFGSKFGLVGAAFGAAAGWVASEVLDHIIELDIAMHNANYYDSKGNLAFEGVIKVQ